MKDDTLGGFGAWLPLEAEPGGRVAAPLVRPSGLSLALSQQAEFSHVHELPKAHAGFLSKRPAATRWRAVD